MTPEQRFRAKVAPANAAGCWLWTAYANAKGYGQFRAAGRNVRAHRHAWARAFGPVPAGLQVLHRCDVPRCVNPAHLFLGTGADNTADMIAKGRNTRGSKSNFAKLTEVQAVGVFHASGLHKDIAARYSIDRSQVSHIKNGKNWAHFTSGLQ